MGLLPNKRESGVRKARATPKNLGQKEQSAYQKQGQCPYICNELLTSNIHFENSRKRIPKEVSLQSVKELPPLSQWWYSLKTNSGKSKIGDKTAMITNTKPFSYIFLSQNEPFVSQTQIPTYVTTLESLF